MKVRLYKKVLPVYNPVMQSFIKNYFVVGYKSNIEHHQCIDIVPPAGTVVIHFSIGKKKFAYNNLDNKNILAIQGQQTQHIQVIAQPGVEIIGVNFHPHGFYNLFGVPVLKLTNSVISAIDFWEGNSVESLQNKLEQINNIEEGICIIENFLWEHRKRKNKFHLYFDSVAEKIIENNGICEISSFLNSSISMRSFERYSSNTIGCSPKKIAQLYRHLYVLKKMLNNPDISLPYLVYYGQYYDISHLYKDFKKFTKLSYNEYLEKDTEFARIILS
jgi:hypothetical protein